MGIQGSLVLHQEHGQPIVYLIVTFLNGMYVTLSNGVSDRGVTLVRLERLGVFLKRGDKESAVPKELN